MCSLDSRPIVSNEAGVTIVVAHIASSAGTNLKVGAHVAPGIFCRAPPFFGSTSTISRFGERFRDGQYS